MILGKVIGSVVATLKDESLTGKKLLLVKAIDLEGNLLAPFVIAVDVVGVGIGEKVLVVNGSSARMTPDTKERCIDAIIVAKVDSMSFQEKG